MLSTKSNSFCHWDKSIPYVSSSNPNCSHLRVSSLCIFFMRVSLLLWSQLIPNAVRIASPFRAFTREITTNDSPCANSLAPSSTTTWSKVRPWLLWMVIAYATVNGSCLRESWLPATFSHRDVTGVIGTHRGSTPSTPNPGLSGPVISHNELLTFI